MFIIIVIYKYNIFHIFKISLYLVLTGYFIKIIQLSVCEEIIEKLLNYSHLTQLII